MEALTFIGACTVTLLLWIILKEFSKFLQRVVVGKYKIKCICKHEFIPYMKWYGGEHGITYTFKCRKCNKEREMKSYQNSKDSSVF